MAAAWVTGQLIGKEGQGSELGLTAVLMLWLTVLIAVVVLGTASLLRAWRETDKNAPWMAVAGLVLLSASIRWGMTPLQGAPLVMGLLCLFVVSIKKGNYFAAFAITTCWC
jgi:hypothetical protein